MLIEEHAFKDDTWNRKGKVKGIPDRGSAWDKVWWQNGQGDSTKLKEDKSNTWKAMSLRAGDIYVKVQGEKTFLKHKISDCGLIDACDHYICACIYIYTHTSVYMTI